MIQVPKSRMDRIAPLFSTSADTLIRSCLEGCMDRAWADDFEHPTAAKICTTDFCFLSGDADSPDAGALAAALPEGYAHPWFYVVPMQPAWEAVIERSFPGRYTPIRRYALQKDGDTFAPEALKRFAAQVPEGCRVLPFDESIYYLSKQEEWSSHLCAWFPTYESFQKHGMGFAAFDGKTLVCGASSHSYYREGIEVEIDTNPTHLRRGLATACAAALILECLRRGLYPSWDAANQESLALAEKLGYRFDREYKAYQVATSI